MQIRLVSTLFALILGGISFAAMAETAADAVSVTDPYVRAVPPGQPNSAAFMQLSNQSDADHILVGAESAVINCCEKRAKYWLGPSGRGPSDPPSEFPSESGSP